MSTRSRVVGVAGALLIAVTSVSGVLASSHREAPLIAGDPAADNTDLYAFVSPDATNSLTIIANFVPLQEPAGGPNFFPFDPAVRYEINVDNNGNGKADVKYQFRFKTHRKAKNFAGIPTFLYNDGAITSLNDPNLLVWQTYDVWRNGHQIAWNVRVPPANIGPRSTADYSSLASAAVRKLSNGDPALRRSARRRVLRRPRLDLRPCRAPTVQHPPRGFRCRPSPASTVSAGSTRTRSPSASRFAS